MNARVAQYLDSLRLTEELRFRFEVLVARCELLLGTEATAVFASEYIAEDVGRVYESLFAFTSAFMMEAQVAQEPLDQVDIVPIRASVKHWILSTTNYDLRHAGEDSRASADVWLAENRVATLRASGRNCDNLLALSIEFIRPNVA